MAFCVCDTVSRYIYLSLIAVMVWCVYVSFLAMYRSSSLSVSLVLSLSHSLSLSRSLTLSLSHSLSLSLSLSFSLSLSLPLSLSLSLSSLIYTSDAADDLHCVDLGGPRLNKKKQTPTYIIPIQPHQHAYYITLSLKSTQPYPHHAYQHYQYH